MIAANSGPGRLREGHVRPQAPYSEQPPKAALSESEDPPLHWGVFGVTGADCKSRVVWIYGMVDTGDS